MNTSCELNVFDLKRVCRTCGRTNRTRFGFDQFFKNKKSVFDLLSILRLNVQLGDGLPQQICLYCCKFLFQMRQFRIRCEVVEKQLQAELSVMQNKIVENHPKINKTIPQTDTKIQQPEKSNESTIPVIKEEQITNDSEMAIPTPSRVANSDDGQSTRSKSLDHDSKMFEIKTVTISRDLENTMYAIKATKEDAIADIYKSISDQSESIIGSCIADRKISIPVDSCAAEDHIKLEDSDNDLDGCLFTNNSRNVLLASDSSGLESDEEQYDVKIRNWQCEYYFNEAQMKRTCNLCNEKFFYYEKHLENCPKYNVKICKYCTLYFRTTTDLEEHMKQMHEGWMLCAICSRPFTDYNKLLEHVESHSTLKCVKCSCNVTLKNRENLTKHIARFHAKRVNKKCPICRPGFTNLELNKKPGRNNKPNLCGYNGQMSRPLLKNKAHKHLHIRCELCGDTFRHLLALKIHKRCHAETTKKFSCEFCEMEFLRKPAFDKHLEVSDCVRNMNDYRCSKCLQPLAKLKEALEHFKTHNTTCKRIHCLRCNLNFRVAENLKRHEYVCYAQYDRPSGQKADKNIYRKVYRNTGRIRRGLSLSQSSICSPLEDRKKTNAESLEIDAQHKESAKQKGGYVDGYSDEPMTNDNTVDNHAICS